MHPYPSLLEALASAREIRSVIASQKMGANSAIAANDIWTLQGFAQWYCFGNPRSPIRQDIGIFSSPAFQAPVNDDEFLGALDGFTSGAPQDGDVNAFAYAPRVNWRAMLIWCCRAIQLWLAQEQLLGTPSE